MSATGDVPDQGRPRLLPAGASSPSPSLPRPRTTLIGREAEIAAVCALLDEASVRLLTLTGPGGVGKTRLAIAVATAVAPHYAHGAWFVRLAAVREPAQVPAAVARALGVRDLGDWPPDRAVLDVLREQHGLVVLDNLEHLLPAALWIDEVLDTCRRLAILITSRSPLRIAGEQRYPVPPLATPAAGERVDPARADDYAALRLFAQRATAVAPGFALDDGNVAAVATICRRLDGVPLAIELAAARINVFGPQELATRLARSLPLLTGGTRDAPARLQSMRAAIAWSYDLLSGDEQALLRWLAVFVGGCTLDEAEAIAAALGHDAAWTLGAVTALVEQSLLRRPPGDERRFFLLETIREFGQEQLAATGDEDAARDAHAEAVLAVIAEAERGQRGPEQRAWLDRLEAEQGNIRAAFAWLAQRGAVERACRATGSLWFFWYGRGYLAEGAQLLDALLAHPQLDQRSLGRATALNVRAMMAIPQGKSDQALALHAEALAIFRTHHDRAGSASVLSDGYYALVLVGDLAQAVANVEEAYALFRALGDTWNAVRAQRILGVLAFRSGDHAQAVRLLEESRQQALAHGDDWVVARASAFLARLAYARATTAAELLAASTLAEEGLRLTRAFGDAFNLPAALLDAATLRRRRGDLAGAALLVAEAQTVATRTGVHAALPYVLGLRAAIARQHGDVVAAAEDLLRGLQTWFEAGRWGDFDLLHELARLARAVGQFERAARLLGAADKVRQRREEVVPAFERAENEADRKAVQHALAAETFALAWGAGQAMTEAEILAEAAALQAAIPVRPAPVAATGLSTRELEILQRMAAGLSNQQIADQLVLSLRTVTTHITSIHTKLGVDSRTAAVAYAIRSGLA